MSAEQAQIVGLPDTAENRVLIADINSAAARSRKAEPGDRLDIARFEALATRLEQLAVNDPQAPRTAVAVPGQSAEVLLFGSDQRDWSPSLPAGVRAAALDTVAAGRLPVLVLHPLTEGDPVGGGDPVPAAGPATRWDSDGVGGRKAVEARFRAQLNGAAGAAGGDRVPISPSGIQNSVVTEALREFAGQVPGSVRVNAPVEYRDGSRSARAFPLRSLPLKDQLPAASLELRFALLSIRHTEMDAVVDGAWLRNAEVSRPRPAGQTDDLVYDITRAQLAELCRGQSHVRLYLYQTGLETAVVGFYKAVTDHLLGYPRSVSVQPMYYETPRGPKPGQRNPEKRVKDQDRLSREPVVEQGALFRKGTPWTM
jgi:hypothetical protein